MSGKADGLQFALGSTFFNGATADATSGAYLEGQEFEHEFRDLSANPAGDYGVGAGMRFKTKIIRNVSGIAILPFRYAVFETATGLYGSQVDGYTTTTAAEGAGVVDPFLAAAGCPNNDLCHIVIEGPCLMISPLTGNGDNVWSAGSILVAITAANGTSHLSTATTADCSNSEASSLLSRSS